MGVTRGATSLRPIIVGRNMKDLEKWNKTQDGHTDKWTGNETGWSMTQANDAEAVVFRRTSRLARTPPQARERAGSAPEVKVPLAGRSRDISRDKRKRPDDDSPPHQDKEEMEVPVEMETVSVRSDTDDSPSDSETNDPDGGKKEKAGKIRVVAEVHLAKKAKNEDRIRDEEVRLRKEIIRLTMRLTRTSKELSELVLKNPNTKVEIKKHIRELRDLEKETVRAQTNYFTVADKKLSAGNTRPVSMASTVTQTEKTKEVASVATQVERAEEKKTSRKERTQLIRSKIESSSSFEEVEAWPEEAFRKVKIREWTPSASTDQDDVAFVLSGTSLKDGFGIDLTGGFPELRDEVEDRLIIGVMEHIQRTVSVVSTCGDQIKESWVVYLLPGGSDRPKAAVYAMLKECLMDAQGKERKKISVMASDKINRGMIRKMLEAIALQVEVDVELLVPSRPNGKPTMVQKVGSRGRGRDLAPAIIVKAKETPYRDVLKKVRDSVDVKGMGVEILTTRKTNGGDLLVVLKPGGKDKEVNNANAEKLRNAIQEKAGARAVVAPGVNPKMTLHINGLDGATTEADIMEALRNTLPKIKEEDIKVNAVWKIRGENQNASVTLPRHMGKMLEELGMLKVGWNSCRVRERIEIPKCYKCWEYGHRAAACPNGDRTSSCKRCGAEGHKAKDCKGEETCHSCQKKGHRGGTSRCPTFRSRFFQNFY